MKSTRLSFRPRPLDLNKQLDIVRDSKDLDNQDGNVSREITHNHEGLDAENEAVLMVQNKKAKGGKEIPIPEVRIVPTYKKDYFPLYKPPVTYLHGKPGQSYYGPNFVEYNLEADDVEWLKIYNGSTAMLTEEKFELMIWKLEVACAEATDKTLLAAGASHADRMSPAACGSLEHFTRSSAMEVLSKVVPFRQPVLDDVYDYWYNKRKARQKPLMRRLQAPTAVSDTNPFNVFRPRERVNRPQTRRRRENDMSTHDKMKTMQSNLQAAAELLETIIRREYKKRDVMNYEVDIQQLKIQTRHEPRAKHEQIEADALAALKARHKRYVDLERDSRDDKWLDRVQAALIDNPTGLLQVGSSEARDALRRASKRKRRIERRPNPNAVAILPAPPTQAPSEMLFLYQIELPDIDPEDTLIPGLPPELRTGRRARFGRGGRLVIDRVSPDWIQPFDPRSFQRPDPYGDGLGVAEDVGVPKSKALKMSAAATPAVANPSPAATALAPAEAAKEAAAA